MTHAGGFHNPRKLLSPGFLLTIAVVSTTQAFAAGGSRRRLPSPIGKQVA